MVQATLDNLWLPKAEVPGLFVIKQVTEKFGKLVRNNREITYQYFILRIANDKGTEWDFEAKFGDKNVLVNLIGVDTDAWVGRAIVIDFNEAGYKYIKSVEVR